MVKMMPNLDLHALWQQYLAPRYEVLAEREQRLLLFAAIVLPLMLLIFGLVLPVQDALHAKQHALAQMQTQAEEAEQLANRVQQQGSQVRVSGSIMTIVDQVARAQKVRSFISSMRPQLGGDHPQLWIRMQKVPYDQALGFYRALNAQGIQIVQIKWQRTQHDGIVQVQAMVQS